MHHLTAEQQLPLIDFWWGEELHVVSKINFSDPCPLKPTELIRFRASVYEVLAPSSWESYRHEPGIVKTTKATTVIDYQHR